jgi:DNA-directed RNA polymerase subunit alpha
LSSLEGFAITSIKIEGVEHEFDTVPGVLEDVTNIILNLKQVRFKRIVDDVENEKVSITVSGSEEFKAGDIGKQLTWIRGVESRIGYLPSRFKRKFTN